MDPAVTVRRLPAQFPARGGISLVRGAVLLGATSVGGSLVSISILLQSRVLVAATVGLWVAAVASALPGGLGDALRVARRRRLLRRLPHEPWFADHAWDPRGAQRSALRAALEDGMWVLLPWTLLTAGVAWGLLTAGRQGGAGAGIAFVCAAFVAGVTLAFFRTASRGSVEVLWRRFPYHPGDAVEIVIGSRPGGPTLERCVLTLRRVEETAAWRFSWLPRARTTYRDQSVPTTAPGPDQHVVATFDVPADAGGTHLAALRPAYWELVVDAVADGRPWLDRFLVPVYDRPRQAA